MAVVRKPKEEAITVSSSDIHWIKNALQGMQVKLQEVDSTLSKLNQTVIGDKNYGQTGLIEKVEEHNTYIEKDKEFKSRLIGGGIVVSFIWGMILKFWKVN